ncbi:sensor histidine kinase [Actinoallomurus rhizosphaericola]|uniref:sensor histidine kinase n=1 Tax=Actinoallomurus rhizosphaericola TaxID=2952536 RepID=UPI002091A11B|nr:histidine kinase [Actinoallomurus rhizosphaericola]MCO5992214.1 histidine kinase [Actinoallomurus rhizosphaericola]
MSITSRFTPDADHPGIGLSSMIPDPRARVAVMLVGLGVSIWTNVVTLPADPGIVAPVALAVAALAWLALIAGTRGGHVAAVAAVMCAAGAVIAVTDTNGLIFTGVAASIAAVAFDPVAALVLATAGPVAHCLAAITHGPFPGRLLTTAAVALAGLAAGASRRETEQRARRSALVATERRRAELARAEAELAGERNRLGRELHDVLAHTLGALSIQLTAIDTLARNDAPREKLITQIELGHELVSRGLDEARQAVRALRGESAPPAAQLERLCELHQAELELVGSRRELDADIMLALYRLTQEALTNAAKHAPGSRVSVRVDFGPQDVTVQVGNTRPAPDAPAALRASGGGFGLQGMRERVEQAGGDLQAGATPDGGWKVAARIPYRQGNRGDGSNR